MLKDMTTRIENAQTEFIQSLIEQFKYTQAEAEKILKFYRKVKAVKLDPIGGRYILQHGAFWDKEILDKALALES